MYGRTEKAIPRPASAFGDAGKNTKDIYPDYLNFKSSIRCWEYSSQFDLQVDNVITEF